MEQQMGWIEDKRDDDSMRLMRKTIAKYWSQIDYRQRELGAT